MKKIIAFVLAFCVMVGVFYLADKPKTAPQPSPPAPWVPQPWVPPTPSQFYTVEQARDTITESEGRRILDYLCSPQLEGRMSGQPGNDQAARFIADHFQKCGLEPGAGGTYFQTFSVQKVNDHKGISTGKTANIIGVLRGTDPILKDEIIVLAAHMDHIGYGPSYSQAPRRREVHPGADDNATGTSLVMQAAKAFSHLKGRTKRTIVFICFSGEEMGLIGANYYCQNPVFPLNKTVIMINQDMIGRYNDKGRITCGGAGRSDLARAAVNRIKDGYPFTVNVTSDSGGGSDHAAFARRGVPVCMFHTGQHSQYHTPDDTPSRIDFRGLALISRFVFHLTYEIANG